MNEIIISGGGLLEGPETLGSEYGELRNMTGASILAPNHILTFTGGSASIGGTIIGKSLLLSGGGNGTVKGSVILTSDVESTFSGGSSITVTSTGAGAIPTTGVSFTGQLAPVATSYTEIAQ
jgi:hypothetical protein